MATATNLEHSQDARIETPHARRGGFGFANGCPCRYCGRRFPTAKGRRRHERRAHERTVPPGTDIDGSSIPGDLGLADPLDDPNLKGDALRMAVNLRLRHLAGLPEAP